MIRRRVAVLATALGVVLAGGVVVASQATAAPLPTAACDYTAGKLTCTIPQTTVTRTVTRTVTSTATVTASPFTSSSSATSSTSASTTPSTATSTTSSPPPPATVLDLPRIPWEGGPDYWAKFPAAQAWTDPAFFPITVFLGKPAHAAQYKALGVNTYQAAEHDGSTIASMTSHGMYVLPQQDEWTKAEVGADPRVPGWFISDECDMGLGGCAAPDGMSGLQAEQYGLKVQQGYVDKVKAYADGRFTQANFGNGILGTFWSPTTMDDHLQLVDAASIDKYAYTSPHVQDLIAGADSWPGTRTRAGVARAATYGWLTDRMTTLEGSSLKPRWMFVEVAKPYLTESGATTISPAQLEGAVWAAIVHEARGINYFQHNNNGTCGTYALVDCEQSRKDKITAVNGKIKALAPVINSQSYRWDTGSGLDTMLKVHQGSAYLFASVGIPSGTGSKTFTLPPGVTGATVEVVGEGRTIPVSGGKFTDSFPAEYTHHVYRVSI